MLVYWFYDNQQITIVNLRKSHCVEAIPLLGARVGRPSSDESYYIIDGRLRFYDYRVKCWCYIKEIKNGINLYNFVIVRIVF